MANVVAADHCASAGPDASTRANSLKYLSFCNTQTTDHQSHNMIVTHGHDIPQTRTGI